MTPEQIIKLFDMKPLPKEGGYYAETYRAPQTLDAAFPRVCTGPRSISTSILYLLTFAVLAALLVSI